MDNVLSEQTKPSEEPLIDNHEVVQKAEEHLRASLHYIYKGYDIRTSQTCPCCGLTTVTHK